MTIWNSQTKTFSGNCEEVETLNADNSILIFCEREGGNEAIDGVEFIFVFILKYLFNLFCCMGS